MPPASAERDMVLAYLTMYKNRQALASATEVRRCTSLNALEHMLRAKQLRLSRIDVFQDRFEGSVPRQQLDDQLPAFSGANAMLMMGNSVAAQHPGATGVLPGQNYPD